MSITLYFSKINVNSHIYDVYDEKEDLNSILKKVYLNIKEDTTYTQTETRTNEIGEEFTYEAYFKFNLIEKSNTDYTIAGNVIKTSNLFVNEINEATGEITKVPVENSEVIPFYFDVYREIVAFYTTNRFGYNVFNYAFKELLNECMSTEDEEFNFEVSILKQGLSVNAIQSQLGQIGKLESLTIEIIPPNPDDDLLDAIQQNGEGEGYLNDIKSGNVTHRSTIFTSKAPDGLNIDAKIIKKELQKIDQIHPQLSSEEAIKYGYVTVEATNKNGRAYSTNDNQPTKYKLNEKPKTLKEFAEICKQKVLAIVGSSQ